jgi:hypothetical protein
MRTNDMPIYANIRGQYQCYTHTEAFITIIEEEPFEKGSLLNAHGP